MAASTAPDTPGGENGDTADAGVAGPARPPPAALRSMTQRPPDSCAPWGEDRRPARLPLEQIGTRAQSSRRRGDGDPLQHGVAARSCVPSGRDLRPAMSSPQTGRRRTAPLDRHGVMMGPSCPGEVSEVSKMRYRKLVKSG